MSPKEAVGGVWEVVERKGAGEKLPSRLPLGMREGRLEAS